MLKSDTSFTPLISVIICTRNRGRKLAVCLEYLSKMSGDISWEVIIADNDSGDDTKEIVNRYVSMDSRFRYLMVKRIGLGAARDAAWRVALGQIISFTDDDCYVAPDFAISVVNAFNENKHAGMIGGRILLYDPGDARITIDEREEPAVIAPYKFVPAGSLQGANISFRAEVLAKVNGFDPELGAGTPFPCEDIDVLAAVVWSGLEVRYDPRPTVSHHHGRKSCDVQNLMSGYDAGRGAYYAKYLIRRDSRFLFFIGWWKIILRKSIAPYAYVKLFREARSALLYFQIKKRYDLSLFLIIGVLIPGQCVIFLCRLIKKISPFVVRRFR
jgi:glycosyltransferase involved in cell wall biosynthesis